MRWPWSRSLDEETDRMAEQALQRAHVPEDESWRSLLGGLTAMREVRPDPETGALAVQRMMLRAQQVREGVAPAREDRRPRAYSRLAAPVATCLASFLMIFGGLTAVSQAAQPGGTLYPLKRFSERMAISSAHGWENTANVELAYAQRRLDEMEKIKNGSSSDENLIPSLVQDFDTKVNAAVGLATGQEGEGSDEIRAHADELNRRLNELEPEHEAGEERHAEDRHTEEQESLQEQESSHGEEAVASEAGAEGTSYEAAASGERSSDHTGDSAESYREAESSARAAD